MRYSPQQQPSKLRWQVVCTHEGRNTPDRLFTALAHSLEEAEAIVERRMESGYSVDRRKTKIQPKDSWT